MSDIGAINNPGGGGGGGGSFTLNNTTDSVTISGGNNVTISNNASTILVSAANQTNQTLGIYASSQTTGQSSSSTFDARSLSLVGQGLASVGWSNSSLLISVTSAAQTNQSLGIYGSSQTTGQSSSSTYDARSLSLVGQGLVSVGWSNSSLLISATSAAQTNQTAGIYASSQTVGQSSSSTYDARSLTIVGSGIASVGWSNSSLLINVPSGGGAGFTAGISGGNTSGNTGTVSQQVVFAGGNNITLSGSTNANSMTITVSALAATNSIWFNGTGATVALSNASNALVYPVIMSNYLTATQGNYYVSINLSTSATSASTNAFTISAGLSIYTRNVSTLSLASSGSQSFGWTFTSNNSTSVLSSLRGFTLPINVFATPGDYWFAFSSSTSSSANLGATVSFAYVTEHNVPYGGLLGATAAASAAMLPGWGQVTVTQSTQSFGFNNLTASASAGRIMPFLALLNIS